MPPYDDPVATVTFRAFVPASVDAVWSTITSSRLTVALFHGMSLVSTWQPGDVVAFVPQQRPPGLVPAPSGRVLHVEPPTRVCFSIEDEASGAATYVAWSLRAVEHGCVVRLQVHDVGVRADEDVEDAWLPVMDALRETLRDEVSGS